MPYLFLSAALLNAACPLWSTKTSGWSSGAKIQWNSKNWKVTQGGNGGIQPEDPNRADWGSYFKEIQDTCTVLSSSSEASSSSAILSSSIGLSSENSSSSSKLQSKVNADSIWQDKWIDNPFQSTKNWLNEKESSTRCAIQGTEKEISSLEGTTFKGQKCFFPDSLRNDTLEVPSNATRFYTTLSVYVV